MLRKLMLTLTMAVGAATTSLSPGYAQDAAYWGRRGAGAAHWSPSGHHPDGGSCCYHHRSGAVAAATVAGLAAGTAVGIASRPLYTASQIMGYAAPPIIYGPPVVYAPGPYYYAR
jgi:hypothetical protein